jgi:hypothetical protein
MLPKFQPGFRLSAIDVIVLVVGSAAAILLWQQTWWIEFIIAFVIAHFFLFCNVFRISRPLELIWAAAFVVTAGATVATGFPGWAAAIVGTLLATTVVLILGMRSPDYHGVLWQRINPNLPQWWNEKTLATKVES